MNIEQVLRGGGGIWISCCQANSIHEKIAETAPIRLEITLPSGWEHPATGSKIACLVQRTSQLTFEEMISKTLEMHSPDIREAGKGGAT